MNMLTVCIPETVRQAIRLEAELLDLNLIEPENMEEAAAILQRPGAPAVVLVGMQGPETGCGEALLLGVQTNAESTLAHAIVLIDRESALEDIPSFPAFTGTVDYLTLPLQPGEFALRLQLARQIVGLRERLSVPIQNRNGDPAAAPVLTETGFLPLMDREIQRAERYLRPLSFLIMHVDPLTDDSAGSSDASERSIVRAVGERCSRVLRAEDYVACIHETDLAALLPETGAPGAAQCAERLRRAFEGKTIQTDSGETVMVTLSIGVATLSSDTATLDELLAAALAASEEARNDGGNTISVSVPRGPLDL